MIDVDGWPAVYVELKVAVATEATDDGSVPAEVQPDSTAVSTISVRNAAKRGMPTQLGGFVPGVDIRLGDGVRLGLGRKVCCSSSNGNLAAGLATYRGADHGQRHPSCGQR
jgi:hypothetical protein